MCLVFWEYFVEFPSRSWFSGLAYSRELEYSESSF